MRKDHLRRHYTSNHKREFYLAQRKDYPFGCDVCQIVFQKKDYFDYHLKSAHPQGMPVIEEPAPDSKHKLRTYTVEILGPATSESRNTQDPNKTNLTLPKSTLMPGRQAAPKPKISLLKQKPPKLAPNTSKNISTTTTRPAPYPINTWKAGEPSGPKPKGPISAPATGVSSTIPTVIDSNTATITESPNAQVPLQQAFSQSSIVLTPEEALAELYSSDGPALKSPVFQLPRESSVLDLQDLIRQSQTPQDVSMQAQNINPSNIPQQAVTLQQLSNQAQEENMSSTVQQVSGPTPLQQVFQQFQPVTVLTQQQGQIIQPQFGDKVPQQQQQQIHQQSQQQMPQPQQISLDHRPHHNQQHHPQQQLQNQQILQLLQTAQGLKQPPNLLQGMQKLSNLASLSQATQDNTQPTGINPSMVNIIGVKPFHLKLVKDQGNTFLLPQQQQQQVQQEHLQQQNQLQQQDTAKAIADAACIISANGQILRANISNPDHCYATAVSGAIDAPQLTQLLSTATKVATSGSGSTQSNPSLKSKKFSGPSLTDEEATRIMAEISNAGLAPNLIAKSDISTGDQSTAHAIPKQQQQQLQLTEFVQQHQLHQMQQQNQLKDLKTQIELHQKQLMQQQQQLQQLQQQPQQQQQQQQHPQKQAQQGPAENVPLLWTENLTDYPLLTSEVSVPSDIQFVTAPDGAIVSAGPGPLRSGANWILQLAQSALDSQQQQQQQIIVVPASTSSSHV